MKSFEELDCWKLATELRRKISETVKSFPKTEQYRLVDQLTRASRSVTALIAEGYGRFHFQENIQFCRQARGSLHEVLDHLIVARDENYISEEQFSNLRIEINRCLSVLNGYINYLVKAKTVDNKVSEPELEYGTDTTDNELTDNR